MKIKVYVVDMEIPRRAKRWMLRLGLPLAVIFGGLTIAYAAVPKRWDPKEPLTSADLNGNFANLDTRLAALESRKLPAITAWATYSPTVSALTTPITTHTTTARWRRVGDTIEVNLLTQFSACSTSGQLRWSLPNGVIPNTPSDIMVGSGHSVNTATGGAWTLNGLTVISQGANSWIVIDQVPGTGGGQTCSTLGGAGRWVRIEFSLPVTGWTVTDP